MFKTIADLNRVKVNEILKLLNSCCPLARELTGTLIKNLNFFVEICYTKQPVYKGGYEKYSKIRLSPNEEKTKINQIQSDVNHVGHILVCFHTISAISRASSDSHVNFSVFSANRLSSTLTQ